jgi:3-hydroxybutyryl-CoA dehydrogenase
MMTVGVVGAGAMGSGIAQVALVHGHKVVLADLDDDATNRARQLIEAALHRDVEKGRLTSDAADSALQQLATVRLPMGLS